MADDKRCPPERLPALERIGWLVAVCIIGEDDDDPCIDCGAESDADDVTEHADHCGLAVALEAYFQFRQQEWAEGKTFTWEHGIRPAPGSPLAGRPCPVCSQPMGITGPNTGICDNERCSGCGREVTTTAPYVAAEPNDWDHFGEAAES